MDAYISKDARQSLEALAILKARTDGFLLGHNRGHRIFVEKIFPSRRGFYPSFEKFHSLNTHFKDRIIGFFSLSPDGRTRQKILAPFALDKLFLEINRQDDQKLDIKSYTINFDKEFFLSPIKLKF